MKRFLSILFAVMMVAAVLAFAVSCGNEKQPVDSETEKQTESQTEKAPDTQSETEKQTESQTEKAPDTQSETQEPESESQTNPPESIPEDTTETNPPETQTDPETSESQTNPPETTPDTQPSTEIIVPTQYADVDFGGKTFNVIYRYETAEEKPSGWGQVFDLFIDEENPDDALSSAVKLFTAYMSSKFNCTVNGVRSASASSTINTAIEANDPTYDMGIIQTSPKGFANGKYYNLLPMIDQSLTCWDNAVIRDLAIGNKLYGITGNCSTSDDDYTWVLFFNKTILAENNLEFPYQLVKDGKWTIEKFLQYSSDCAKNLDGEEGISNANGKDIFGFITHGEHARAIWTGAGVRMAGTVQADGTIKTSCFSLGYEADIYQKVLDIMYDASTGYANKQSNMGVPEGLRSVFAAGRAAFYGEVLQNIGNSYQSGCLKDIEGLSFGVIPQPKWNEEQENYYHYVNTQASFMGVPITANYATATTFLNVYGLVFEQTVQAKFISNVATAWVSDPDVADMMRLIFDSRVWDAGYWYEPSAVDSMLLSDVNANKNRYAKRVPGGADKLQAALDTLLGNVSKLTV